MHKFDRMLVSWFVALFGAVLLGAGSGEIRDAVESGEPIATVSIVLTVVGVVLFFVAVAILIGGAHKDRRLVGDLVAKLSPYDFFPARENGDLSDKFFNFEVYLKSLNPEFDFYYRPTRPDPTTFRVAFHCRLEKQHFALLTDLYEESSGGFRTFSWLEVYEGKDENHERRTYQSAKVMATESLVHGAGNNYSTEFFVERSVFAEWRALTAAAARKD